MLLLLIEIVKPVFLFDCWEVNCAYLYNFSETVEIDSNIPVTHSWEYQMDGWVKHRRQIWLHCYG